MIIRYEEILNGLKHAGPYQCEYQDFQKYWANRPDTVRQVLVFTPTERWLWIKKYGWRKLAPQSTK